MKCLVSLSGGMDSTTVLAQALYLGRVVEAVGFCYGAKHNEYENKAAETIARFYKVPFCLLDLSLIASNLSSNLLRSGGNIPEGYYQDETMKKTVVPGRNLIFSSILMGIAWSRGAPEVWLGIHAGDHAIYPDCRPDFFRAMKSAVELGSDDKVTLVAPFLYVDKIEILRCGLELHVPYGMTRTCYKDQPVACGKCGACQERLQAFGLLGKIDPISYEGCLR